MPAWQISLQRPALFVAGLVTYALAGLTWPSAMADDNSYDGTWSLSAYCSANGQAALATLTAASVVKVEQGRGTLKATLGRSSAALVIEFNASAGGQVRLIGKILPYDTIAPGDKFDREVSVSDNHITLDENWSQRRCHFDLTRVKASPSGSSIVTADAIPTVTPPPASPITQPPAARTTVRQPDRAATADVGTQRASNDLDDLTRKTFERIREKIAAEQAEIARQNLDADQQRLELQKQKLATQQADLDRQRQELERQRSAAAAERSARETAVLAERQRQEEERRRQAQLDFDPGRYHALVIGNNTYKNLPKLKTAVGDAQAIAKLLGEKYGFHVTLLTDGSRYQILSAIDRLRSTLKLDDNLLIYFAGHGVLDEVSDRGYWLPVDADPDIRANWISTADLTDGIRAMDSRHVMVVADSCYSGMLLRAAATVPREGADRSVWLKRMEGKRSRTALTSGGVEPVADGGGSGHSVFTKALLDILSDNADAIDGQTLFSLVRRPVVLNADQTPAYADIRSAGHDGGDFILVPAALRDSAATRR